ncbi:MAG: helicase-associated domain-containing protein [Treponema sp.]|nr:helicase-associated domain-containing protein [Treponema sp.]
MLKNNSDEKQRVQRILAWQEAMATLPDSRFFDIMRVYLGEVKTPYNKQRLIEQLGAFLYKEQNRKNLVSLLDDFDKKIITAVYLLPNVTQTKLSDFFSGEYTLSQLYPQLINLTDRLILYKDKQTRDEQQYIRINPLLESILTPYISIDRILPAAVCAVRIDDAHFCLSPEFIAAFVSYIIEKPELCKADGIIKKNNEARLEEIFPDKSKCLQLLLTAFLNLQLVKQTEKSIICDKDKFAAFAELSSKKQYAYLCAASAGRLSREGLRSQTQLFLDCAASIPPGGATRDILLREAVLLGDTTVRQNRFSRMIEQARQRQLIPGEATGQLFDRIIDSAEVFGLFSVAGRTGKGEKIYTPGTPFINEPVFKDQPGKVVNIDAGFTITILPGLPLKKLLPLVSFLSVTRCNTVVEFEINRISTIRAFDTGYTAEEIYKQLSEYTPYDIPQNLRISIEDWYNSYSSAMMYKGYILKLDAKNAQLIEKNPNAAQYIQIKLALGIYLLDIDNEEEAAKFVNKCGLDFIGKVQSKKTEVQPASFPLLNENSSSLLKDYRKKTIPREEKNSNVSVIKDLHKLLDTLDLSPLQKNGLSLRIENKMILSAEQLKGSTVRAENLEASGIDFLGKIRLIESAISSKDMIELVLPSEKDASKQETFLGTPLQITKETGDALLHMQLEPQKETCTFFISRASSVKLIRTSLF